MINASARFKRNAKAPVKTVQMRMTQVVGEGETPIVYSSADLIKSIKVEASSTWLYSGAKKATVVLVDELPFYANYEWVIELGIVDPTSNEIDYITLGTFTTVTDDVDYEKGTTTLGLYDYMQKAEKDWHDNSHVGYPKTVEALATGIATNVGCAGLSSMAGLPNISQMVQEDLWALISQEKYRDVINEIANITGSTAIVDSNNLLKFVPFSSPIDELTYSNLKKYKLGLPYGPINSVVLSRQPQNDDVALSDNVSITENGLTEAKIVNNEIADDDRPTFIQPLFNALNGTAFDGIEMETEGHGWYEIGDAITVSERPSGELPEGYQQVEFIQSTGTQCIDTGFKATPLTRTRATYAFTQTGTKQQRVFGWQAGSGIWYSQYLNGGGGTGFSFQDDIGNWQYCGGTLDANKKYTFDMDGKARTATSYDANGNVRGTKDMSSFNATKTATGNLYLFCEGAPTLANFAYLKMYSVKMWDNNQLIRDFVPCYRKIDNKPGMYDLVNGVFYTNAGSGEFIIGDEVYDVLPNAYEEIEYIEKPDANTMQPTIDTGFMPNENTEVEVEFSISEKGTYGGLMGSSVWRQTGVPNDSGLAVRLANLSSLTINNYSTSANSLSADYTTKHTLSLMKDGTYLDGERKLTNRGTGGFTINSTIAIFSIKRNGVYAWGNEKGKVYRFKIWDNGVLARDMVPVIRRSDGMAGLYDKINGTFYHSVDSTTFNAGPKVNRKVVVVTDLTINLDGGGFKETIKCVTPDLTSTDYTATGGIKKSIYNTEIKTDRQQQEITSIVSRQDSFEDQVNEEFTQVYQNIAGLTVSVQTTGGGNYIKNSVGYSKDSDNNLVNWEFAGSGNYSSQTSPESMQAGAISGNQISLFNGTLTQRITLAPNIEYTLSYIGKKSVTGVAGIIIRNDNGQFNVLMPDQTAVYWEKQEITFTPTLGYVDIIITANADVTEFAITDIMLSQGDLSTPWRQADGEILNTQVAVDTEGVRVKSSIYEGDETVMTPLEFAGYSSVSGSKQKVFSLNRDTTEVQKISIQQQMSMPPLKVIPLDSPSGWAFVKEGN